MTAGFDPKGNEVGDEIVSAVVERLRYNPSHFNDRLLLGLKGPMSESVRAQISSRRCQSAELRANRDTSRPSTTPTSPIPTAATSFWKPSRFAVGTGLPEIAIDDHDAVPFPAHGNGALLEPVLALGTLGVLEYLPQCALAHVQVGQPLEVIGGHLLMLLAVHA